MYTSQINTTSIHRKHPNIIYTTFLLEKWGKSLCIIHTLACAAFLHTLFWPFLQYHSFDSDRWADLIFMLKNPHNPLRSQGSDSRNADIIYERYSTCTIIVYNLLGFVYNSMGFVSS